MAVSRPLFSKLRSSKTFIFWTAAVGLFTSTFVHSILFPLSPFIVRRIQNGDGENYHNASALTSDTDTLSKETGILITLYAVGLLVGSPIFGWLGDRVKQRRLPMLLGITASMSANYVFMFATAYWMLLVARFLQGMANACVWTLSLCLIADNWPSDKLGLQMGKLVGFYPLGLIVGLPTGGVLYSHLGFRSPFIASAILCGIDFFMRFVLIEPCHSPKEWFNHGDPHSDEEKSEATRAESNAEEKLTPKRVTTLQLLKHSRMVISLLLTIAVATAMSAFEPTLSMRLAAEWNFSAAECGLILISYMVPSVLSSAVCGWLTDKYGAKIVELVCLCLAIPSCLLMGVPNHQNSPFWVFIPVLALSGTAIAGCQAPVFPEIAHVVALENKRADKDGLAKSYAMFNAAYGIGMSIGPIVGGFLYGSIGFFWLCAVISACFCFCLPFVYLFTGGNRKFIVRQSTKIDDAAITASVLD